jgi:hypothetical protein
MKRQLLLAPIIASIVFTSLIFIPQTSHAIISGGVNVELEIGFEYPKNLNQLKNDYGKNLRPELETIIGNFGSDFSNFSFAVHEQKSYCRLLLSPITKVLNDGYDCHLDFPKTTWNNAIVINQMGENVTSGNTIYQLSPNLVMYGTNSTMTESEFNMEYNTTVALLRIAIMNFLTDNNASNVTTEMHFTYGKQIFDEGF